MGATEQTKPTRTSPTEGQTAAPNGAAPQAEIPRWLKRFGPLLTRDQLATLPKPRTLIGPYLQAGGVNLIHGTSASGKSFLAIDMACSVATPAAWCGWTPQPGKVIYWALEGKGGLDLRIEAWEQHHNIKVPLDRFIVPQGSPKLDVALVRADLEAMAAEIKPVLLVIDTLGRAKGSLRENHEEEVGRLFTEWLPEIAERTQTTILVVHHQGHEGDHRSRGTSAIKGNIDHEYETKRGELGRITLTHLKAKDAEEEPPATFQMTSVAHSIVLIPQGTTRDDLPLPERVAAALQKMAQSNLLAGDSQPIKTSELAAELGVSGQRLSDLTKADLDAVGVIRHNPGRPRPTTWRLK